IVVELPAVGLVLRGRRVTVEVAAAAVEMDGKAQEVRLAQILEDARVELLALQVSGALELVVLLERIGRIGRCVPGSELSGVAAHEHASESVGAETGAQRKRPGALRARHQQVDGAAGG